MSYFTDRSTVTARCRIVIYVSMVMLDDVGIHDRTLDVLDRHTIALVLFKIFAK